MIVLLCMSMYLAVFPTHSQSTKSDNLDYGIILDAGSSGTKVKIYTWNSRIRHRSRGNQTTLQYDLKMTADWKFPPGISSKAYKTHEVPSYLAPIIETAKQAVPIDKHANTPIYFLATAGRFTPISRRVLCFTDFY